MESGLVLCSVISFAIMIVCAVMSTMYLTDGAKRTFRYGAVMGLLALCVCMFTGCESNEQATAKDSMQKLRDMAPETHEAYQRLSRKHFKATAPSTTTNVTGANVTLNWNTAGTAYSVQGTLAAGSTLTQTPPVVVTPPPVLTEFPGQTAAAVSSGILDDLTKWPWKWNHDAGTPGATTNATSVYPALGHDGKTMSGTQFTASQTGLAGEIWHLSFASGDTTSHGFVYDAWVQIADVTQVANLEMDMNQVDSAGKTYILATQCSQYDGKWDYTKVANGSVHWYPSNIPCTMKSWAPKSWHHIEIQTHRDDLGNVFYDWVSVDGVQTWFQNCSGPSAEALGWATVELLNFQLDGYKSSGTMQATIDQLQIWKW